MRTSLPGKCWPPAWYSTLPIWRRNRRSLFETDDSSAAWAQLERVLLKARGQFAPEGPSSLYQLETSRSIGGVRRRVSGIRA